MLVHKRRLDVDLGELGLAVGAQILITIAAGDLVVLVYRRHHQHLLEKLRRLRQREELARVRAARYQIVPRPFRRRLRQRWRFDVPEALVFQKPSHMAGSVSAQLQTLQHFRAAQVQKAMLQTHVFAGIGVFVQLNGRRCRFVEHGEVYAEHFHRASLHVWIDGILGTPTNTSNQAQHVFVANPIGDFKAGRRVWIVDHLNDASAVADIQKDDATVIAPTVYPAEQLHRLAHLGQGDVATVVTTAGGSARFLCGR